MFKKRTRPANVRAKEDSPSLGANAEASTSSSTQDHTTTQDEDDIEPSVGSTISDLMSLRRFRKQAEGLDLDKLNRGEVRKRKKKQKEQQADGSAEGTPAAEGEEDGSEEDEDGGEELTIGGLKQGRGEQAHEQDDASARMKRLIKSSAFTQQTNALDVDKHMAAYIEAELLKRRGGVPLDEPDDAATAAAKKAAAYDPQEELYAIAEQYRNEQRVKQKGEDDEEGNVVNSMAMLTAIPEVDLGMDARLKNIEDTEKAKRAMIEARKLLVEPTEAENDFAAARFYRPSARLQSDQQALAEAKREAQGLPAAPKKTNQHGGPGGKKAEMATDDVVMERFKKRMRKN